MTTMHLSSPSMRSLFLNLPFKRYVFFFFFFFFWNSSTEEQMRFLRTALRVLTSLGAMLDILD